MQTAFLRSRRRPQYPTTAKGAIFKQDVIDQSTWRDRKSKYELVSNLESMQSRSETLRLDEVNDICYFIQPQNS